MPLYVSLFKILVLEKISILFIFMKISLYLIMKTFKNISNDLFYESSLSYIYTYNVCMCQCKCYLFFKIVFKK